MANQYDDRSAPQRARADASPLRPDDRGTARGVLPWLIGAVVVLVLAVAGGLFAAWLVANMRAVPAPAVGDAAPTPRATAIGSPAAGASGELATTAPTVPPRRTPTPSPEISVEPEPYVHVVQRGESLSEIAQLYQVDVDDVVELNDIRNRNRIQVGQEILIPGYGTPPE